jgi:hypothetical protein
MKKHVLTLILFCIVAGHINAQSVTAGIKGGLNISDVSSMNGDNRLSGHFGLFIHSRFNRNWAIQPELLYSGQGQQFVVINHEYTLALNYLQVPIMFQFYPAKQVFLEFGPQLGFLLSAKVKDDDNKTEVDESYKKVDAGLALGFGIQATPMLGFYARYNAGLADITKNDNRDYFNRVGQIGMSIKFK